MATTFEFLFPYESPRAAEFAASAGDLIDDLEAQLTVYRDDSEVALLNARAADEAVPVEPRLFQLLTRAQVLSQATGGAFDITAGPLIKAWGFYRRQGRVPTPAERTAALGCVGMRHIELNADDQTVRFRRAGVEINLGSIGKGYALDRCAAQLRRGGIRQALLHGGGSSVLAIGAQPGDSLGWPVGIRHPWNESQRLGIVHLRDRALATSAATYQNFEYNSRKFGHLLDPRNGWPAEGIASATALAATAADADALATAFFVLGVEKTRLFCQTHHGIGAILLPAADNSPLAVFGLAADDFSLAPPPCRIAD